MDTFINVKDVLAARFGVAFKLGLTICPYNFAPTTKQIAAPILEHLRHCTFPDHAYPMRPINLPSGEIMMDGSCGSQKGYGMRDLGEEREIYYWYVITVVVYPSAIQILVDEGPVLDHMTFGYKYVDNMQVGPPFHDQRLASSLTYNDSLMSMGAGHVLQISNAPLQTPSVSMCLKTSILPRGLLGSSSLATSMSRPQSSFQTQ